MLRPPPVSPSVSHVDLMYIYQFFNLFFNDLIHHVTKRNRGIRNLYTEYHMRNSGPICVDFNVRKTVTVSTEEEPASHLPFTCHQIGFTLKRQKNSHTSLPVSPLLFSPCVFFPPLYTVKKSHVPRRMLHAV